MFQTLIYFGLQILEMNLYDSFKLRMLCYIFGFVKLCFPLTFKFKLVKQFWWLKSLRQFLMDS